MVLYKILYKAGMARVTTYSEARAHLKAYCDEVAEGGPPIIIRRQNGGDAALVSLDELVGLEETAHLLRSRRMRAGSWRRSRTSVRRRTTGPQRSCRSRTSASSTASMSERQAVFASYFLEDLEYRVREWPVTGSRPPQTPLSSHRRRSFTVPLEVL